MLCHTAIRIKSLWRALFWDNSGRGAAWLHRREMYLTEKQLSHFICQSRHWQDIPCVVKTSDALRITLRNDSINCICFSIKNLFVNIRYD